MQDRLSDLAHRAAEAFMAANRSSEPDEAARFRQEAYCLVEQIKSEEEERLRAPLLQGS